MNFTYLWRYAICAILLSPLVAMEKETPSQYNARILLPFDRPLVVKLCRIVDSETRLRLAQTCKLINIRMRVRTPKDGEAFTSIPYDLFETQFPKIDFTAENITYWRKLFLHKLADMIRKRTPDDTNKRGIRQKFIDYVMPKTKNPDIIGILLWRLFSEEVYNIHFAIMDQAIDILEPWRALCVLSQVENLSAETLTAMCSE